MRFLLAALVGVSYAQKTAPMEVKASVDARANLNAVCPEVSARCGVPFGPVAPADKLASALDCMLKVDLSRIPRGPCYETMKAFLANHMISVSDDSRQVPYPPNMMPPMMPPMRPYSLPNGYSLWTRDPNMVSRPAYQQFPSPRDFFIATLGSRGSSQEGGERTPWRDDEGKDSKDEKHSEPSKSVSKHGKFPWHSNSDGGDEKAKDESWSDSTEGNRKRSSEIEDEMRQDTKHGKPSKWHHENREKKKSGTDEERDHKDSRESSKYRGRSEREGKDSKDEKRSKIFERDNDSESKFSKRDSDRDEERNRKDSHESSRPYRDHTEREGRDSKDEKHSKIFERDNDSESKPSDRENKYSKPWERDSESRHSKPWERDSKPWDHESKKSKPWDRDSESKHSKPWERDSESKHSKPWDRDSESKHSKPWERDSESKHSKPWERDSESKHSKPWDRDSESKHSKPWDRDSESKHSKPWDRDSESKHSKPWDRDSESKHSKPWDRDSESKHSKPWDRDSESKHSKPWELESKPWERESDSKPFKRFSDIWGSTKHSEDKDCSKHSEDTWGSKNRDEIHRSSKGNGPSFLDQYHHGPPSPYTWRNSFPQRPDFPWHRSPSFPVSANPRYVGYPFGQKVPSMARLFHAWSSPLKASPPMQFRDNQSSAAAPSFSRAIQSIIASRSRTAQSSPNVEIAFKGPARVPTAEIAPSESSSTNTEKQAKAPERISYRSAP